MGYLEPIQYGRDTVVYIDLDAITHNIREFQKHLPSNTCIMSVVKADAYGHGAIPVAQTALEAGVSFLGVSMVDEGVELRQAGIDAPILILGYTPAHAVETALKHRLSITIPTEENLEVVIQEAERLQLTAHLHFKVDTGMGRLGFFPDKVPSMVIKGLNSKYVFLEGLYTHFATADERDKTYTIQQQKQFLQVVKAIQEMGIEIPFIHLNNSAGAIEFSDHSFDMIRLGISMYGFYPSLEVNQHAVDLRPVLSLKSKIVQLKKPPVGWGISYGKTKVVDGNQWIATVPIGYADGISRRLSNRGFALVNGVRVPIVGRVCMDQLMLDVTRAQPVRVGDEVVFIGQQEDEEIHADEVAQLLDTINYEITCMLGRRIPRIYWKNGQPVYVINRLVNM